MHNRVGKWGLNLVVALLVVASSASLASAATYTSPSYKIDASTMNNFGGAGSSTNYKMVSSGGESIIGQGSSGSYLLASGYVAQLQSSMRIAVQPNGLMAYYPLDEPSGTFIADYSETPTNGTLVASPSFVTGKLGGGVAFNGTTQYASLGSTSSLQGTTFTLEAWVKTSTSGATMAVISKGSNYWLGFDFGKVAIYDWTASSTCKTTSSYTDGNWHHVAATLVSGVTNGSIIYVDGVQRQTCTWTPVAQDGQPGLGAAKGGSWAQFYNGSIDHVKIFNRVMTADEIKAEYDAGAAGSTAGLAFASDIVPGVSQTVSFDTIVQTDSFGYTLATNQNQNLTSGGNSIPAISGSIASPLTWVEGTTKGLGFTLTGTNATALPGSWSSGNAYAAFPASATTFYTRTGSSSAKDVVNMRLRLDTDMTQPTGDYSNVITIQGTITP